MKFILLVLFLTSPVSAHVPRELKERIGKTLQDNEEFKKAFVYYLEMYDELYENEVSTDLVSFKSQYLKYVQSKRCMGFLSNMELLNRIETFANDLDLEHKKKPNYAKVQSLMDEDAAYEIRTSYKNSPMIDGYKECSFKVSEAAIKASQSKLKSSAISKSKLPVEDKKQLVFKDNKLMQKALKVLTDDQKNFFTNKKLSDPEREKLADKIQDDLKCAMYFASSDQIISVIMVFSDTLDELKSDPNYIKESDMNISKSRSNQVDSLNGDYNKCSFTPDPQELEKFKKTKESDKKIVDERYNLLQKMVAKSHPKIQELVKLYESQITENIKDKEMARSLFIDKFPDYLEQVNQTLAYSMHGMMKDKECYEKVLDKVQKCAVDEKYVLVNDKINLLMSVCVQDSKEELKSSCKFNQ